MYNKIYSTEDLHRMSLNELEKREKEISEYFSHLGERYPRSSGHPFMSDSEQLRLAQEERDLHNVAMMEIMAEKRKRRSLRPYFFEEGT